MTKALINYTNIDSVPCDIEKLRIIEVHFASKNKSTFFAYKDCGVVNEGECIADYCFHNLSAWTGKISRHEFDKLRFLITEHGNPKKQIQLAR